MTRDLLYADDTLLVGGKAHVLQKYMDCIIGLGVEYGLELNWSKVEMMKVGVQADVLKPDGAPVTVKEALVYLGPLLHRDGRVDSELCRRLGTATADFNQLQKVWRHTNLSKRERYSVYVSCVLSRLLHGLRQCGY